MCSMSLIITQGEAAIELIKAGSNLDIQNKVCITHYILQPVAVTIHVYNY